MRAYLADEFGGAIQAVQQDVVALTFGGGECAVGQRQQRNARAGSVKLAGKVDALVRCEGVTGDSHDRSMQAAQADELIRLIQAWPRRDGFEPGELQDLAAIREERLVIADAQERGPAVAPGCGTGATLCLGLHADAFPERFHRYCVGPGSANSGALV